MVSMDVRKANCRKSALFFDFEGDTHFRHVFALMNNGAKEWRSRPHPRRIAHPFGMPTRMLHSDFRDIRRPSCLFLVSVKHQSN